MSKYPKPTPEQHRLLTLILGKQTADRLSTDEGVDEMMSGYLVSPDPFPAMVKRKEPKR